MNHLPYAYLDASILQILCSNEPQKELKVSEKEETKPFDPKEIRPSAGAIQSYPMGTSLEVQGGMSLPMLAIPMAIGAFLGLLVIAGVIRLPF